jgi:hypothetical protein
MGDGISRNCLERLYEARCEIERLETALSSQRARVIEECAAIVSERLARYKSRGTPDCDPTGVRAAEASGILSALRALSQQDTGQS